MAPTDAVLTGALPHDRVRVLTTKLRQLVESGKVDPTSVIDLLKTAASLGASWAVAEDVLVELAKGADGIAGTADDLIPPMTVQLIKVMVRHGVVRDIAAWAQSVGAPVAARCGFLATLRRWLKA